MRITFVVEELYDIRRLFELLENPSYADVDHMKRVGTSAYEVAISTVYPADELLEDMRHINVTPIRIVTEGEHEDFRDIDFEKHIYPKRKPKNRVST